MENGIIYRVTSPSGKTYIGQTVQPLQRRKHNHIYAANDPKNERYNTKFSRAIRKWGDQLRWEILYREVPTSRLSDFERWTIGYYDSFKNGYNSTTGGDIPPMLGRCHTRETKDKISKKNKGRSSNRKGIKLSKETREKISQIQLGRKASRKTREKMSLAHRGSRHHAALFKDRDVRRIRDLNSRGMLQRSLARAYKVHKTTISDIVRYKSWSHVSNKPNQEDEMSGKVTVIIDPKSGEAKFEVNGVVGSKCEDITSALERNNEVLDKQYTEEYDIPDELPDYIHDPMEGMEDE